MKIAVLGAGAMGSIYGGHLSLHNEVYMIDKKADLVEKINADGLKLFENDTDVTYRPKALLSSEGLGEADLVILFVKSLFSEAALEENSHIIGKNTYVMTLQNGAGHEDILAKFVPMERIIIGTTEDNGAILDNAYVRRGGMGKTNIGMLVNDTEGMLGKVKESFDACGFDTHIYGNIQQLIWDKLFTNVSLSALTGVLQVPILTRYAFVWLIIISATYMFGQREHINISVIRDRFKGKARLVLNIIIECVTILFSALVMVYGGITITRMNFVQYDSILHIPTGIIYSIIPICGVIIIFYSIYNICQDIKNPDYR